MIDITQPPYNCVGDGGLTDNAAGLLTAIVAAAAAKTGVFVPAGHFGASPITLPPTLGPLRIIGENEHVSQLMAINPATDFITDTSPAPLTLERLSFGSKMGQQTAGAYYKADPGYPNQKDQLGLYHLITGNAYDAFDLARCCYFQSDWTKHFYHARYAWRIRNLTAGDSGDSRIAHTRTLVSGPNANSVGIGYESSGGLVVSDSKFLGGQVGFFMNLAAGVITCDLNIIGCSIEGQSLNGILLGSQGSGAVFKRVCIIGGNVAEQPIPIATTTPDGARWLSQLVISGVNVSLGSLGGIDIDGAENSMISGNTVVSEGATPNYCIVMRPHTWANVTGPNKMAGSSIDTALDQGTGNHWVSS